MKKLKIAQLAPLWEPVPPKKYGGIEIMIKALTDELVKRGHQVTLFATGNSKTKAKLKSVFPKSLLEEKVDWYHRSQNLINAANVFGRADEFDIIHNHIGDNALFFTNACRTPVLTTLHNVLPDPKNRYSDEYITFRHYARKTNFVSISFDQRIHTDLKLKYVSTVYNGVNINSFSFNEKPKDYLVWLGRIHYGKGLRNAINVAKKSKQRLIVAGGATCETDEKYFESVKPMIDGKQIKYIGQVSPKEKNELLGNAKALLFPTMWEEPFGLVMIEAMACGTPVIAFNRGSVPEVVKTIPHLASPKRGRNISIPHLASPKRGGTFLPLLGGARGGTGFVVENEKEMIEAIKNIDKINRIDCRKHVENNFTVEKMVDKYERVYEKIIRNRK